MNVKKKFSKYKICKQNRSKLSAVFLCSDYLSVSDTMYCKCNLSSVHALTFLRAKLHYFRELQTLSEIVKVRHRKWYNRWRYKRFQGVGFGRELN